MEMKSTKKQNSNDKHLKHEEKKSKHENKSKLIGRREQAVQASEQAEPPRDWCCCCGNVGSSSGGVDCNERLCSMFRSNPCSSIISCSANSNMPWWCCSKSSASASAAAVPLAALRCDSREERRDCGSNKRPAKSRQALTTRITTSTLRNRNRANSRVLLLPCSVPKTAPRRWRTRSNCLAISRLAAEQTAHQILFLLCKSLEC